MKKLYFILLFLGISTYCYADDLTYSHTDFNNIQPGWSDTLTIYNNTDQAITITQLEFDTNNGNLDAGSIYGSLVHLAKFDSVNQISAIDYQYTLTTKSQYNNQYAVIPAHSSADLNQIPIAHEQKSQNGMPIYYRLPYNLKVKLYNGKEVSLAIEGKCQGEACKDPVANKLLGAYFTNWANYHYTSAPQNMLMPNQIPVANLNTIFYDVGKIDNTTADVSCTDINHDQYYLPAFDILKRQYPYLNLIYSFGGWGDAGSNSYPSYDLAKIFDQNNPQLIAKLAKNMVNTMLELGFNGIDIDYEWDAIQPGTNNAMQLTPARAQGFQELLQDIRSELNKIQPQNNSNFYKLTIAVFAGEDKVKDFIENGGTWSKVAAAVDYVDLMTYDFHGQFDAPGGSVPPNADAITGFLSAMQTSHLYQNEDINHYNVVDAVNAYKKVSVPDNKIVVGVPAYTRIEQTAAAINDDNKGLYLKLADISLQPKGESGSGGTTDYKCIVDNNFCWNGFSFDRANLTMVPANLTDNGLGAKAKTPWAYDKSNNWFMSFDDGKSAQYKGNWIKNNKLGGAMVWEIDGDIPQTAGTFKQNSVIYNLWQGIIN